MGKNVSRMARQQMGRASALSAATSICALMVLAGLWGSRQAEAVTIIPSDTGIAQGALVDRPLAYQTNVLDSTAASGAKWIRLDLWWFQVETTQGTYNWTKFDNLYALAKSKGLNVMLVVSGTPTWASGCGSVWCPPDAAHDTQWRSFLTAATNRYKDPALYNIHTYEIWNEPNIQLFFEVPNASVYVNRVLKPAYQSVIAADPAATILSGGTSPAESNHAVDIAPWEFVRDMYAAGGKSYFHHIAHHPYTWPYEPAYGSASWNAFKQMYENPPATPEDPSPKSIRQYMLDNGDGGKQIWSTEIGYPTGSCEDCIAEAEQKNMVARVYNEWAKKDFLGKIFWYAMLDAGTTASDPEHNFGLKKADNTAKPALDNFSKIASEKYAAVVKADAPRHYWKMGELSYTEPMKNEMDASANGYYISGNILMGTNGTVVGTPAPTFLETANNRAEVDYNADSIRLSGSAWTVEFNARRAGGTVGWPGLMGRGSSTGPDGWEIYNHHAGGDFVSFKRNNLECRTATNVLADGKSHHFAVRYQSSTVQWYVDGAAVSGVGTCSVTYPTPSTAAYRLWIGASPASPGNNALGHIAIYDMALSPTQIAAHASAAVRLP